MVHYAALRKNQHAYPVSVWRITVYKFTNAQIIVKFGIKTLLIPVVYIFHVLDCVWGVKLKFPTKAFLSARLTAYHV